MIALCWSFFVPHLVEGRARKQDRKGQVRMTLGGAVGKKEWEEEKEEH